MEVDRVARGRARSPASATPANQRHPRCYSRHGLQQFQDHPPRRLGGVPQGAQARRGTSRSSRRAAAQPRPPRVLGAGGGNGEPVPRGRHAGSGKSSFATSERDVRAEVRCPRAPAGWPTPDRRPSGTPPRVRQERAPGVGPRDSSSRARAAHGACAGHQETIDRVKALGRRDAIDAELAVEVQALWHNADHRRGGPDGGRADT